jgi:hypothetical protein
MIFIFLRKLIEKFKDGFPSDWESLLKKYPPQKSDGKGYSPCPSINSIILYSSNANANQTSTQPSTTSSKKEKKKSPSSKQPSDSTRSEDKKTTKRKIEKEENEVTPASKKQKMV